MDTCMSFTITATIIVYFSLRDTILPCVLRDNIAPSKISLFYNVGCLIYGMSKLRWSIIGMLQILLGYLSTNKDLVEIN